MNIPASSKKTKNNSLTRQSLFLAAGKGTAYLFQIFMPIILVRVFTQDEYGLYRQLYLVFNTLLSIGQMGVSQSLYYFLPRYPENKGSLMTHTFFFVSGMGVISFLLLILFPENISSAMKSPDMSIYLNAIATFTFFMISASFLEIGLIAEGRAGTASIVTIISQILQTGIMIIAALVTKNLLYVIYGAVFFSLLRFLGQLFYLRRFFNLSFGNISFQLWKKQLGYSLPIGIGNITYLLQTQLHRFFVTFFFNPATFAVYAIGCFKLPILNIVTSSVANVMMPALSKYQKEKNHKKIIETWNNSIRKMNLIFFPVFCFFFLMADEFIVSMFTQDYLESIPVFRISLLYLLVSAINTGAMLQAYAETRYLMMVGFLRLPAAAGIIFLFISNWGVLGAITADIVVLYLFRIILLKKIADVIHIPFFSVLDWRVNGKILFISLCAAIPSALLKFIPTFPPLVVIVISVLLYLPGYLMLIFKFNILEDSEKESLRMWFAGKFDQIKLLLQLKKSSTQ